LTDNNVNSSELSAHELWAQQEAFKQVHANNQSVLDLYERLGREFYWEAGNYKITLTVETDSPHKKYKIPYKFSLSAEDVAQIDLNRVAITQAAMLSEFQPNFIYAEDLNN